MVSGTTAGGSGREIISGEAGIGVWSPTLVERSNNPVKDMSSEPEARDFDRWFADLRFGPGLGATDF
jgi:hypothetical protein